VSVSGTIVFETERLIVRLASEDDLDFYLALWTNPDVMRHMGFPRGIPMTRERMGEILSAQGETEFDRLLVIELKATGQPIGECKLSRPDEDGVSEPDIKLLPAYWGHGYGTEAWQDIVSYQFRNTDCEAIVTTPNVANIAAIRLYEAAGAMRTGESVYEFPEAMRDFTTPVHSYTYRLSRSSWQQKAQEYK
jgi:RimJ/RimL family protein N-acetyltransferase